MMTMSLEDPHQVETHMEKQLEKHHHEALVGANALTTMADGLPPLGNRLKAVIDEDATFYHVIRDILVAHLHGNAAQVSVEIGRGSVPSEYQPSFQVLEASLNSIPPDGA